MKQAVILVSRLYLRRLAFAFAITDGVHDEPSEVPVLDDTVMAVVDLHLWGVSTVVY